MFTFTQQLVQGPWFLALHHLSSFRSSRPRWFLKKIWGAHVCGAERKHRESIRISRQNNNVQEDLYMRYIYSQIIVTSSEMTLWGSLRLYLVPFFQDLPWCNNNSFTRPFGGELPSSQAVSVDTPNDEVFWVSSGWDNIDIVRAEITQVRRQTLSAHVPLVSFATNMSQYRTDYTLIFRLKTIGTVAPSLSAYRHFSFTLGKTGIEP